MRHSTRGMTLIEVLVAFVLLSLSLGVVFHIFAGGMRNAQTAEGYSRAVFLAESKLAAVGAEYAVAPGDHSGAIGTNQQWQIVVAPVVEASESGARGPSSLRLYHVRVQVKWVEGGKPRQLELNSLRLGPAV